MNESRFVDLIDKKFTNGIRKEDAVSSTFKESLDSMIWYFACNCVVEYEIDPILDDFINFVENNHIYAKSGKDCDDIINYAEKNWDKGLSEDIEGAIEQAQKEYHTEMYECDVVAPNGGVVFGDVAGIGPITFPDECGEKGSGDLPTPSGKVYQQVAPFGQFIKMKKRKTKAKGKKKKFRKEDEPCVHSENPPMYNYVDDFRDYVDRTYNNIDKRR